jgi:Rad3-related DNA helicase
VAAPDSRGWRGSAVTGQRGDSQTAVVLELLRPHSNGLGLDDILAALRRRWPRISAQQAVALLRSAGVTKVGDRFVAPAMEDDDRRGAEAGAARLVCFDLEATYRVSVRPPYQERYIVEIGAVRSGTDSHWVESARTFRRGIAVPDDSEWMATNSGRGQLVDLPAALDAFAEFVDGAEVLLAYNGIELDFPEIDKACVDHGRDRILPHGRVDALYLGYCVWPFPEISHRLFDLCANAGVSLSDLSAHNALDDAEALTRLVAEAARTVAAWAPPLLDLITPVVARSRAWQMLLILAGLPTERPSLIDADVAAILEDLLGASRAVRRTVPPTPLLTLPDEIRSADGSVDPYLLARFAADDPQRVQSRPAQSEMAHTLRGWMAAGRDGMIEAPTGTGKSLAALAVAIEWLAADPENRAILATHTKQLQVQLAEDIERITRRHAAFGAQTGLVKGKANRLSLRVLVEELADAGDGEGSVPSELLAFLALRLIAAQHTLLQHAEARSVDDQDIPSFFSEFFGQRAGFLAAPLSQAAGGDFSLVNDEAITHHTQDLAESLAGKRLIITNHALLLAHPDDITRPEKTLLVMDEAHSLEGTATDALSNEVSYGDIEALSAHLTSWVRGLHGVPPDLIESLRNVTRDYEDILKTERLPNSAMTAFDQIGGPLQRQHPARSIPLASPYTGDVGRTAIYQVLRQARRLGQITEVICKLAAVYQSRRREAGDMDRFERDRLLTMLQSARRICDALLALSSCADAVFSGPHDEPHPDDDDAAADGDGDGGTRAGADAAGGSTVPAASSSGNRRAGAGAVPATDAALVSADSDQEATDDTAQMGTADAAEAGDETADGEGHIADGDGGDGPLPLRELPNWVVWAQENDRVPHRADPRGYRFQLRASPIELRRHPDWRDFRHRFAVTFLMSATLRVAERWDFIRGRLGLPEDEVTASHVGNPFDMRNQALLLGLADFPSWAEHSSQALRLVAHQVARFAVETTRVLEPDGPFCHGAMVLTTSTAAAAGIAEETQRALAKRGVRIPLFPAPILSNRVAIDEYRGRGGVLVGTKGLWAGVDIEDPHRTRLLWINKLPFPAFNDPLIGARRAAVERAARGRGDDDPEFAATRDYYLPLAAMELRQGAGRLIRGPEHRGVIVISDRKLAGDTPLRRLYRELFLGSLDQGLWREDPETSEPVGRNVLAMQDAWPQIWHFLGEGGEVSSQRVAELCSAESLEEQCLLPETRRVLAEELTPAEVDVLLVAGPGVLEAEVLRRCEVVAGCLRGDGFAALKPEQAAVIERVARGEDTLALLPTGLGKSFCFQLPGLVLPGVTVVVSPLVSLMQDQALDLNKTIGGAVRAIVGTMRESASRQGKREVAEQLTGEADHGIRIVYMSPERFAHRQVRQWLARGAELGCVRHIAIDEAHTLAQWGEDFRPSFRRLATFLTDMRARSPRRIALSALTATATPSVIETLRVRVFGLHPTDNSGDPATYAAITASPIRLDLPVYRRALAGVSGGPLNRAWITRRVVDTLTGHAIFYCLTVREVENLFHQLRDHLGPQQAHRVQRFHGRLSEAEKGAVLQLFKDAPRLGDEGFAPVIVVATSAFGLGINREDVRCVFATSPPTDLSALYQQLGRAGRDQVNPGERVTSPGLAIGFGRGFRTAEFMVTQDLPAPILELTADRVLHCGGVVDTAGIGDDMLRIGLERNLLPGAPERWLGQVDRFRVGTVWAVAALANLGALEDRGDFPQTIRVRPGPTAVPPEEQALVKCVLAAGGHLSRVTVSALHSAALQAGIEDVNEDHASFWVDLIDAHNYGWLDVSQAPNRRWLTSVAVLSQKIPEGWARAVAGRKESGIRELAILHQFFASSRCVNQDLAEYFRVQVPDSVCSDGHCRCSSCWPTVFDDPPDLYSAFVNPGPRPQVSDQDRRRQIRTDEAVEALLLDNFRGLGMRTMQTILSGTDTFWDNNQKRRRPLAARHLYHRVFGSLPGISNALVEASLGRLVDAGSVVQQDRVWRLVRHIQSEAQRAQRQAARGARP